MGFRDFNGGLGGTCMDCTERHPACHDTCERYNEAKQQRDIQREKIKKAKEKDFLYSDYHMSRMAIVKKIKYGKEKR